MTGRQVIAFFSQCQHAPGGHLLWVGPCNKEGYGIFRDGGTAHLAHRYALKAMTPGGEAPEGKWALHNEACPKNCIQIAHLKWGTPSENAISAWEAGKMNRPKLDLDQLASLVAAVESGVPTGKATAAFGVHRNYLSDRKHKAKKREESKLKSAS